MIDNPALFTLAASSYPYRDGVLVERSIIGDGAVAFIALGSDRDKVAHLNEAETRDLIAALASTLPAPKTLADLGDAAIKKGLRVRAIEGVEAEVDEDHLPKVGEVYIVDAESTDYDGDLLLKKEGDTARFPRSYYAKPAFLVEAEPQATAPATVGSVVVKVEADTSDFEAKIAKITEQVEALVARVEAVEPKDVEPEPAFKVGDLVRIVENVLPSGERGGLGDSIVGKEGAVRRVGVNSFGKPFVEAFGGYRLAPHAFEKVEQDFSPVFVEGDVVRVSWPSWEGLAVLRNSSGGTSPIFTLGSSSKEYARAQMLTGDMEGSTGGFEKGYIEHAKACETAPASGSKIVALRDFRTMGRSVKKGDVYEVIMTVGKYLAAHPVGEPDNGIGGIEWSGFAPA